MRTGIANLPLHGGKAPRWLFERMTKLAREVSIAIVEDSGPEGLIARLTDPFWFQAFGAVLGFDWHSSGVTTTVCGALKEGVKGLEDELGFFAAGGKGATSRKTPSEIIEAGDLISIDPQKLVYASKMSAKVDSVALQDGYQLYHHAFFFTKGGRWAVVQQGMNEENRYARRYHWTGIGDKPLSGEFTLEPHSAICCDASSPALNMVAKESTEARKVTSELSWEGPQKISSELERLKTLSLPRRHHVELADINPQRLHKIFLSTYEKKPADFEGLIALEGVGPKTVRALALIAELAYGVKPSFDDPVRFSFAHGGKDGHPYPVDRNAYDRSIEFLRVALRRSKAGDTLKTDALKRLARFEKTDGK